MKKLFKYALVTLVMFVLLEVLSGIVIFSAHRFFGAPKRISLFRVHPLFTKTNVLSYEHNWAETFPVFGYVNRIHYSDECGFTTDRHGFIHNGNKSRGISKDDFTVFILGGSTVAGHGSSCNDQTIPAHLEKLINKKYPDVKVVNAGTSGYYSAIELSRLTQEIMFYDPDIVISFGGTNDFLKPTETFKNREHTYYVGKYHKKLYKTFEQSNSLFWSFKNFLYNCTRFTEYTYTRFVVQKGISFLAGRTASSSKSDIIDNVKSIVGNVKLSDEQKEYSEPGFESSYEQKIQNYISYVRQSNAVVTGMGYKYYFMLQPILLAEERDLPPKENKAREIVKSAYFNRDNIDIEGRAKYFWNSMGKKLRVSEIRFVSLINTFPDGEEVYVDHQHYSDHGNLLIAKKIYETLEGDQAIPADYLEK